MAIIRIGSALGVAAQDRFGLQSPSTPLTVSLTRLTQRVHVRNNQVLGIWVLVIVVQVWGKHMILGTWTLRVTSWLYVMGHATMNLRIPPTTRPLLSGKQCTTGLALVKARLRWPLCDRSRPKTQNNQPILSPRCSTIRKSSDLREPQGF